MPRDLNSKKQSNGLPPDGVILKMGKTGGEKLDRVEHCRGTFEVIFWL
jgi:hypothetical protein